MKKRLTDIEVIQGRRKFLAASAMAIPGVGALLSCLRIREAGFEILCAGWPDIKIMTFTDRTLTATYGGSQMLVTDEGGWKLLSRANCRCRVRRSAPGELLIDWLYLSSDQGFALENFSAWQRARTPQQEQHASRWSSAQLLSSRRPYGRKSEDA